MINLEEILRVGWEEIGVELGVERVRSVGLQASGGRGQCLRKRSVRRNCFGNFLGVGWEVLLVDLWVSINLG